MFHPKPQTLLALAMLLGGCGAIMPPIAEQSFEAKLKAGIQTNQDWFDQYKIEDKAFKFISSDFQNCGSVKDELANLITPEASTTLQKRMKDKSSSLATELNFLKTYASEMAKVGVGFKIGTQIVSTLAGAGGGFAAGKDGAALVKAMIGPTGYVGQDIALMIIAEYSKRKLDSTIDSLKVDVVTPLKDDQDYYFTLWDSCVAEKFAYMREIPLDPVKFQKYRGNLHSIPSFAAQSSEVELNKEYVLYLNNRKTQLALKQDLGKALDDIKTANDNIASGKALNASILGQFGNSDNGSNAGTSSPQDKPGGASAQGASAQTGTNSQQGGSAALPDLSNMCQALAILLKEVGDTNPPSCAAAQAKAS